MDPIAIAMHLNFQSCFTSMIHRGSLDWNSNCQIRPTWGYSRKKRKRRGNKRYWCWSQPFKNEVILFAFLVWEKIKTVFTAKTNSIVRMWPLKVYAYFPKSRRQLFSKHKHMRKQGLENLRFGYLSIQTNIIFLIR